MRVGVAQPFGRNDMVRTSFAQIRMLCSLALVVTAVFAITLGWDMSIAAGRFDHDGLRATPSLTLMVLRCAELSSGVSPAAPALLCIACIYAWCVGRMARLGLAHAAAVAAPPDGESDLASTPIRLVLHPGYSAGTGSDLGFTAIERELVNTIWRPITGPYYPIATVVLGFFPLVLFTLKPFSTLESVPGTLFVGCGLALGAFLAGVTLIQLVQYWLALQRGLKRALEHPLGAAFRTVPAFARDSVEHQVSRTPDEGLRWSACALQFQNLMRVANALPENRVLERRRTTLAHASAELELLRDGALTTSHDSVESADAAVAVDSATRAELEAFGADPLVRPADRLARGVIRAAASVMNVLQAAWSADGAPRSAAEPLEQPAERLAEEPALQDAVAHAAFGPPAQGATAFRADESPPPARRRSRIDSGKVAVPTARRERAVLDNPRVASAKGEDAGAPSARQEDALTPVEASFDAAELKWLRAAQTFVATVVTLLLYRHVRQFRYFLWVTTSCTLLLLLALVSYPFEPYRLILTYAWVVTGSVVGVCLWVFISMDRNTLMSHIAGTSPDQVTFNTAFWLRVFAWGVVPLLSVAAAQYPGVANFLLGILSPFTRALR